MAILVLSSKKGTLHPRPVPNPILLPVTLQGELGPRLGGLGLRGEQELRTPAGKHP